MNGPFGTGLLGGHHRRLGGCGFWRDFALPELKVAAVAVLDESQYGPHEGTGPGSREGG